MFRRNERPQPDAIEVIIGPRATYNGVLRSDTSIRIDGVMESGLLETPANVILSESAQVHCEIHAHNVSIRGRFNGIIRVDRAELLAGCQVSGTLYVNSFLLDEGATLDGELHIRGDIVEEPLALPSTPEPIPVLPSHSRHEEQI